MLHNAFQVKLLAPVLGFSVLILAATVLSVVTGAATQTTTEDVTVTTNSATPNGSADKVAKISSDGRHVYFISCASNLVANDTNGVCDLFARDRLTNTTSRINVSNSGQQDNVGVSSFDVSDGGKYVVFASAGNTLITPDYSNSDIYLYNRNTSQISVLFRGNQFQSAEQPAISGDGKWITFRTQLTHQPYNDSNNKIYAKNRQTGQLDCISVGMSSTASNQGSSSPDINYDGSVIVFDSLATNLVSGDTNNQSDIFLWKRIGNNISRISISSSGSQANHYSQWPKMSNDGNKVAFDSYATNIATGATAAAQFKVLVHDVSSASTSLVNTTGSGVEGNNQAWVVDISKDGDTIGFTSSASNLVSGDTNSAQDMFINELETNTVTRVSVDSSGNQISSNTLGGAGVSADGQYITFRDDNYLYLRY